MSVYVLNPSSTLVGTSSSSGSFSTNSGSLTDVTNLSVTLTLRGRPMLLTMIPDGSGVASLAQTDNSATCKLAFLKGGSSVAEIRVPTNAAGGASASGFSFSFIDATLTTGSATYKVQASSSSNNFSVANWKLVVVEL